MSTQNEQQLLQAAQQGQGKAQYELANRLAAKPDYPEAMRWMKQAADQVGPLAADADIRGKAALQVGSWYQAGLGEPKNPVLAKQWWQRSAKLGNAEASYQLGQDCRQRYKGKLASECLDWFEQAAKRDHANAQLALGQWYAGQHRSPGHFNGPAHLVKAVSRSLFYTLLRLLQRLTRKEN